MTGLSPAVGGRDTRGHEARPASPVPGVQTAYTRASIPITVIALACAVAAAVVLVTGSSAVVLRAMCVGIACGVLIIAVVVLMTANSVGRRLAGQLAFLRNQAMRGQEELRRMTDQTLRGERPSPPAAVPPPGRTASADPFRMLAYDLGQMQQAAGTAIVQVAERTHGRPEQRVEIFMNLARRMQSLVHREIELLDSLEAQVEDPDLLKGLFTVDHLATRMRRQSESLAVLGGSSSRRQWTRQVSMHEVLRAAVAEVEQYSRVKIVPPVEGLVRGPAVADVIHLVAELVENATKFSAPRTQVLLRAQQVTAGTAVEIEDRGLGILPSDQQRMNALLADPSRIELEELLRDGRIGLYVVATLARRHEIRAQLQGNIYGGTSAIIVLPWELLGSDRERELGHAGNGHRTSGPMPAGEQASAPEESRRGAELPRRHGAREVQPGAVPNRPGAVPDRGPGSERELVTAGGSTPAGGTPTGAMTLGGRMTPPPSGPHGPSNHTGGQSSPGGQPPQPPDGRPPLPRRQAQASLAGQLRDQPGSAGPGTGPTSVRRSDPLQEHTPGLMADFLRGVSLSEDEDTWPDPDGTTR